MKEQQRLEAAGCENIKVFNLINNYGYKFKKAAKKHCLEHVLNVYGAAVDWWELDGKVFDTLDQALAYIQ